MSNPVKVAWLHGPMVYDNIISVHSFARIYYSPLFYCPCLLNTCVCQLNSCVCQLSTCLSAQYLCSSAQYLCSSAQYLFVISIPFCQLNTCICQLNTRVCHNHQSGNYLWHAPLPNIFHFNNLTMMKLKLLTRHKYICPHGWNTVAKALLAQLGTFLKKLSPLMSLIWNCFECHFQFYTLTEQTALNWYFTLYN